MTRAIHPAGVKPIALLAGGLLSLVALAGCSPASEVHEPQPPAVRQAEKLQREAAMIQCLNEEGWGVSLSEHGGIKAGISREQEDQFHATVTACVDELGYDVVREVSDDELLALYDELSDSAACLKEKGFQPEEPPSRQVFIDAHRQSRVPWDPWSTIPPSEVFGALEICPPPPPIY